jgi:CRP/FNR family transcriptional regulator, cyclic AMP receptor protein
VSERVRPVEPKDKVLSGVELLSGLDAAMLRRLSEACRWRRFLPHQQIIDKQNENRDIFFVIEGRVRVVNYSLGGRELTLDELPPGTFFGEMSAIDGLPRSARVISVAHTLIAALDHKAFIQTLEAHADIALKLMVHLIATIRQSNARIMDLSTLAANNRIQAELLRRAKTTKQNRAEIKPIPVHGDIAARIGTARETVARVLNDLARQGIIERTRDSLVIHDVEKLRSLVDEVRGD